MSLVARRCDVPAQPGVKKKTRDQYHRAPLRHHEYTSPIWLLKVWGYTATHNRFMCVQGSRFLHQFKAPSSSHPRKTVSKQRLNAALRHQRIFCHQNTGDRDPWAPKIITAQSDRIRGNTQRPTGGARRHALEMPRVSTPLCPDQKNVTETEGLPRRRMLRINVRRATTIQ